MRLMMLAVKDLAGGAHRSAFRLHQALRSSGVDATLAVMSKSSTDSFVHELCGREAGWIRRGRGFLDRVPAPCLIKREEPISLGVRSARLDLLVERFRPDVVHLHWVNGGMVSIEAISRCTVPTVWTMHDMWTFTGGCHYSGDCERFTEDCAGCPKLCQIPLIRRAPEWVHGRKRRGWTSRPLHAIAPSQWMAEMARRSSLFRHAEIATIGYCIDPAIYNPTTRAESRRRLGLSNDEQAILFVNADQARKGALIIGETLQRLRAIEPSRKFRFLFAGGMPPDVGVDDAQVMRLPSTHDEAAMASYYAAADVFVLPSYEDNLPNVIIEALACGTAVVAFPSGGIPEMVTLQRNGLLTKERTAASLADCLTDFFHRPFSSRERIHADAVERYSGTVVASKHVQFYENVLRSRSEKPDSA